LIFSLHSFPTRRSSDLLVILWNRSPGLNISEDWFSTAQYHDIKAGHHGFEQIAIAIGGNYNLTGQGDPERVGVIRVTLPSQVVVDRKSTRLNSSHQIIS